jgi:primosomal protein N' (replication factor Y)
MNAAASARRVAVLLPLPLASPYDYEVPQDVTLAVGDYVRVPLGNRTVTGIVWELETKGGVAESKLRPIVDRLPNPPLRGEMRQLVAWIAGYTLAPPGAVLRMAMAPEDAFAVDPIKLAYAFGRAPSEGETLTPARRRVLEALAGKSAQSAADLASAAGCGAGVVRAMAAAGLLREVALPTRSSRDQPDPDLPFPPFSEAQLRAANAIVAAVEVGGYVPFLLDGVTGSGKTEVYFRAIAAALRAGRQILVLLPEIALGAQWHERFARQFGCRAAAWHSGIRPTERRRLWRDVAEGTARVVVGARSALFLPFRDLGLIVVDEEHDASFKQEDGVVYHARDMAVVRASLNEVPIVLASATPSLETLANVERGRYRHLVLPDRHGGALLPTVALIDMRIDKPARGHFIAPRLAAAIAETLTAGEQAMLFLNRRGYAPLTLCRTCGFRVQCPHCTAWLVEHRLQARLICHHCGFQQAPPEHCPSCDDTRSFAPCGPGVERLAEEVAERFPAARTAIMASDTLDGPAALVDLIRAVGDHEIDLLIGTQMMAKGHHFPKLTLVGVVDADLGLNGGDLRAAERTFQMLHQVAGRAGRAERPGTVLVQTFDPEHPVMAALAANDRDRLLAVEAAGRRDRHLPPFGRLAALILSAEAAEQAETAAAALARAAPHLRGVEILGPAPAPLAVLRGRHRVRFLVKTERQVNIQAVVSAWLAGVRVAGSVRIQVDIDPYSFL